VALLHANPQRRLIFLRSLLRTNLVCRRLQLQLAQSLPVYVRGEATLPLIRGASCSKFQKILDHRGIVLNELSRTGHLQLGRAYAMQRDTTKHAPRTRISSHFEDADADIPILKQGKAEFRETGSRPDVHSEMIRADHGG